MDEAVSVRRNIIIGPGKAILFGVGTGIFTVVIYNIMYNLWMAVFINTSIDEHLVVTEVTIAGFQVHAVLILIPAMAGALFALAFYGKGNLVRLLTGNAVAVAIMAAFFFVATSAYYHPSPLEFFIYSLDPHSGLTMPGYMVSGMPAALVLAIASFLIWSTAGTFIAYLLVSKAIIKWKPDSARRWGIAGTGLVSLLAIAPPAAAYIALIC